MSHDHPGVHSRNQRPLSDREISPEERREWTIAVAAKDADESVQLQSAMIFRLDSEWLALATSVFLEVIPVTSIHSLPHQREGSIVGIANVRGELLTCISIHGTLGIASAKDDASTSRFLVAEYRAHRFVVVVDEVDSVRRYDPRSLHAVPATLANATPRFTTGILRINDRVIGLLDTELLMSQIDRMFA